jgi:hypothetical protein
MLHRVFALLVALVLFGSGLVGQERAIILAASTACEHVDAGPVEVVAQAARDGSAGGHACDDASDHALEGAPDLPALMMALPHAAVPSLTMSRPGPYARAAWRAPYLDGPQRPPCATPLVA